MADPPKPGFPRRDPQDPEFWNLRYEARYTPWDAGNVPERLRSFVAALGSARRVLVPGCGSAWDVRFFAESGWNVLGIDFSPEALGAARPVLGPHAACVREADFFAAIAEAPFDVVYERAFLCALPRRLWPAWGRRVGELLVPGGLLAGFFYIVNIPSARSSTMEAGERGPPFPLHSQAELASLLEPAFDLGEDAPVEDSIPVFAGKERWQVWRRR